MTAAATAAMDLHVEWQYLGVGAMCGTYIDDGSYYIPDIAVRGDIKPRQ